MRLLNLATAGLLIAAVAAKAQVSPVFDMGVLTNSLSQDANVQHECRRAHLRTAECRRGTSPSAPAAPVKLKPGEFIAAALPPGGRIDPRHPRNRLYGFNPRTGLPDMICAEMPRGAFCRRLG